MAFIKRRTSCWGLILSCLGFMFVAVPATAKVTATCTVDQKLAPSTECVESISFGGLTRTFIVHVPPNYTGQPVPLVLDLHGYTGNADSQRGVSGQLAKSDLLDFIVVWPDGVPNTNGAGGESWNAHDCCGTAHKMHVDDVGFLRQVISTIESQAMINAERVYFTGWSNGGAMTQLMGCTSADIVRAIAPVAFPLGSGIACKPAKPITEFAIHGSADMTVAYGPPYNVAATSNFGSEEDSQARWADILGCDPASLEPGDTTVTHQSSYTSCPADSISGQPVKVSLLTVVGAGHNVYQTPGSTDPNHVDVATFIWDNVFNDSN